MLKRDPAALIAAASEARRFAAAPYSKFAVGAALLADSGQVITGANVESASYGLTCCAERIALFKALTDGHTGFVAMAIVAPVHGGPTPCGACRQLLAEYAPDAVLWSADAAQLSQIKEFRVQELLPQAFTGASLKSSV